MERESTARSHSVTRDTPSANVHYLSLVVFCFSGNETFAK